MKHFASILLIYVLVHGSTGDHVRSYEGQSETTILSLLSGEGKTGEFITQKEYQTFIDTHQPPPPDTSVRDQVILVIKNPLSTDKQKLEALIKLVVPNQ